MRSTFMGLETNKRGLYTQQSGLYTTGHNISNANTLGYSRQRVNMQATAGFPGVGLNTPTMPGFLGTGVEAGSIQRIRDGFVDQQFRQESNKLGYWESRSKAIGQMEDVLNEPSQYGLQKSMSEFWQSLNDLAVNPENGGARKVVIQRGKAVADSFNYLYNSLKEIQTGIGKEMELATDPDKGAINAILQGIADLNRQISEVEPNGYLPNDLYDERDLLLDQLSQYLPIEVDYKESGGRALSIAEGSVTVKLKLKDGTKVNLVEGNIAGKVEMNPSTLQEDGNNLPVTGIKVTKPGGGSEEIEHSEMSDVGKLKSLMNSYGVAEGDKAEGLYPDMLNKLNEMAKVFADKFNDIHKTGSDLNGDKGEDFFAFDGDETAGNIKVIITDASKVAASDADLKEEGNGNIAKKLAGMQFDTIAGTGTSLDGMTLQGFFQGVIGQLGVDGEHAAKLAINTATLLGAVEHRRASISSVSLDEEMTNMIQFQQAYNASARMITVIDETLDKIINGMGVVGR